MVVERNWKYLLGVALIITISVFMAGVALGWTLDHFRSNELLENIKRSELMTESILVEEAFIDHYGGDRCDLLNARVYDLQNLVQTTRSQLSKWGEGDSFQANDFDYLKRKLIILEIKFYLLLDDLRNSCGADYNVILFFYKKDDALSASQGYILDELSQKYPNLIVLSIDKEYLDEPLVTLIMEKYDVQTAPTLIINGKIKFEGFTSRAQIESAIK